MALFGRTSAYLGLDIGTSSLKVVELLDRKRRFEVATYGQANLPNLLVQVGIDEAEALRRMTTVLSRLLDKAGVSAEAVVAALPSSTVFSTVLTMPHLPETDMDQAVRFAARDVVPANIDEMVLGWSRLGDLPHMAGVDAVAHTAPVDAATGTAVTPATQTQPVFVTAAPKDIVHRYTRLMELVGLELVALEVETFPLVRSLLGGERGSALIVDIGAEVTTYHLIEVGTPRLSHTVDYGGQHVTAAVAETLHINEAEAEALKVQHGLETEVEPAVHQAIETANMQMMKQARRLLDLFKGQRGQHITRVILIGAGANMLGIAPAWSAYLERSVMVGNPWSGLSFSEQLGNRMQQLAPTFAVAVGLAQRALRSA